MFSAPHFTNDEAARLLLEEIRWPNGRNCPHCGSVDRSYLTKRAQKCGASVYRCGEPECRKDFSVTTKSVMESSHIPLHKWMQGFYLMASSKKGVSSHQLHRTLGITYKAAWFMSHRIREAMRADGTFGPLSGERSSRQTRPIMDPSQSRSAARPQREASHSPRAAIPVQQTIDQSSP